MTTQSVYVLDTSIVIDGWLSKQIKSGNFNNSKIVIPNVVIAEIEYQSNQGFSTGRAGLDELIELRNLEKAGFIEIELYGQRPSLDQIKLSSGGELDELIRSVAYELNATLITMDKIQSKVAEVQGINVILVKPMHVNGYNIEDFFDKDIMSIHLAEGNPPRAKRGSPGNWQLVELSDEILTRDELKLLIEDIMFKAKAMPDTFFEIQDRGATVIQMQNLRIVITTPPFSNKYEITAVRPIIHLTIEDYNLDRQLLARLDTRAEGILVAGSPGAGKSTFAAALAERYANQNKVVKTIEKPRDLEVPDSITQYTTLSDNMERTADVLLLVRPDYCIYDELRRTEDFQFFADLRFAGVGVVGVVHANEPIDAVQRFLSRVELGQISRVIDTVIFLKGGKITHVSSLNLAVRVPSGLTEKDLARPVVEVRDFHTGALEYEIYTFGEQTIVVPIKSAKKRRGKKESKLIVPSISIDKKHIVIFVGREYADHKITILSNGTPLFDAFVGKEGIAKIRKKTKNGRLLFNHISAGSEIKVQT